MDPDPEIAAMTALTSLPEDAQRRVLAWLSCRLGVAARSVKLRFILIQGAQRADRCA
jgi:hypothetical protein